LYVGLDPRRRAAFCFWARESKKWRPNQARPPVPVRKLIGGSALANSSIRSVCIVLPTGSLVEVSSNFRNRLTFGVCDVGEVTHRQSPLRRRSNPQQSLVHDYNARRCQICSKLLTRNPVPPVTGEEHRSVVAAAADAVEARHKRDIKWPD
jgi:hypothetical protein